MFGSIEKSIGVITEHFASAFPLWVAPQQVVVLPVTDIAGEYADMIARKLNDSGFRVEVNHRFEKLGYKIREAQGMKIPYMIIVVDKDIENNTIPIHHRSFANLGAMPYDDFETLLKEEQRTKLIK